jgi:photosystem II oxygen-evolving enhancer protein 3
LYKPGDAAYTARAKATIAESKIRLSKIPAYVEKKQWFNVTDELTRYMYETRGAVRALAVTPAQKKAAEEFFLAIEATSNGARLKKGDACAAAAAKSITTLDAFTATL